MAKARRTIKLVNKTLIKQRKKAIKNLYEQMPVPSWRVLAREIFQDKIKHGVLNKFAMKPHYVPADPEILEELGLIKKPNPYRPLPKYYKRTPQALAYYQHTADLIRRTGAVAKRLLKEARQ